MINLISLNADALTYLKEKWNSEVAELQRQMDKEQKRLDSRLEREEDNTQQIQEALLAMENAQSILDAMIQANVNQESIILQQAAVAALTDTYNEEVQGESNLAPEDVQLALINIDILAAEKSVKEARVAEIVQILSTNED